MLCSLFWDGIWGVEGAMHLDILTIGVGLVSFGIFLVIHVVTFRRLRPEELLRSLHACVAAIAALPLALMTLLFVMKAADASPAQWLLASLLALTMAGLSSLAYVLCIFGPSETSVRMRLVREIAKGEAKGVSHEELLQHYNARTIVNIRLRRLTGSGDIIEQNGLYRARNTRNMFFLFDSIAVMIKKWIG